MGNYTSSNQILEEHVLIKFYDYENTVIDSSHRDKDGALFAIKYSDPETMDRSEENMRAINILTRRRADFQTCDIVTLFIPKVTNLLVAKERSDRLVGKLRDIVSNIPRQDLPTLTIQTFCIDVKYDDKAYAEQLKQTFVKVCDILNINVVQFVIHVNNIWNVPLAHDFIASLSQRRRPE